MREALPQCCGGQEVSGVSVVLHIIGGHGGVAHPNDTFKKYVDYEEKDLITCSRQRHPQTQ